MLACAPGCDGDVALNVGGEKTFFDRPYFLSSLLLQICLYIMGAENLNVCSLMEIFFQNKIMFFLVPGISMCFLTVCNC